MKINDLENETRALSADMLVVLQKHRDLHLKNRDLIEPTYKQEFEKPYFFRTFLLVTNMPESTDLIPFIGSLVSDFRHIFDMGDDFDPQSFSDNNLLDQFFAVLGLLQLLQVAQESFDELKCNSKRK